MTDPFKRLSRTVNTRLQRRARIEDLPAARTSYPIQRLAEYGLIDKNPYQQYPVRYAYQLTDKGRSLSPLLKEMAAWGKHNIAGTKARMKLDL